MAVSVDCLVGSTNFVGGGGVATGCAASRTRGGGGSAGSGPLFDGTKSRLLNRQPSAVFTYTSS